MVDVSAHLANRGVRVGGVVFGNKADDEPSNGTANHAHERVHSSGGDVCSVHSLDRESELGDNKTGYNRLTRDGETLFKQKFMEVRPWLKGADRVAGTTNKQKKNCSTHVEGRNTWARM